MQTYGFLTAVNHIDFLFLKRPVVMFHLGKKNQKYLRIHQRSWPKDIRSMEWGNWTFLSCIQRWKFTIGQSPRHFILQPSCDSCDHFSYLGFMKKKKKKSMWFKTFWGFNHSESPVLRSPVKPQPKMRNFTTDSQSPIIQRTLLNQLSWPLATQLATGHSAGHWPLATGHSAGHWPINWAVNWPLQRDSKA